MSRSSFMRFTLVKLQKIIQISPTLFHKKTKMAAFSILFPQTTNFAHNLHLLYCLLFTVILHSLGLKGHFAKNSSKSVSNYRLFS